MSEEISSVLSILSSPKEEVKEDNKKEILDENIEYNTFDVRKFISELTQININQNAYVESVPSISGYSIASDCIMMTLKKIMRTPIESYISPWLPIMMRGVIGEAIHNFIQNNTKQFTELEKSIKVPSINFSGRIDALIGPNILVEIKSCTYKDYETILKSNKPRENDFYQALTYKYILENYLDEVKNPGVETRTEPPMLDKYDIKKIQFIYVAHEIFSADHENIHKSIKFAAEVRKQLESKKNPFSFIQAIDINLENIDISNHLDYIKNKIERINYYLNTGKLPDITDEFVDKTKCFFCLYKSVCEILF